MNTIINILLPAMVFCAILPSQTPFETDIINTESGDLAITFIAHASLRLEYQGRIIYLDPCSHFADYTGMPTADFILITHSHFDHLDTLAIREISDTTTRIIGARQVGDTLPAITVMANGDTMDMDGIRIQAVPAYNLIHKRDTGQVYHLKGDGNGYVITVSDVRVYVAGDTENIPEMKELEKIDIAFLPMNLPYTMTSVMVADAVGMFHPKILYPYHTGDTDIQTLIDLMMDIRECEVRVRNLK